MKDKILLIKITSKTRTRMSIAEISRWSGDFRQSWSSEQYVDNCICLAKHDFILVSRSEPKSRWKGCRVSVLHCASVIPNLYSLLKGSNTWEKRRKQQERIKERKTTHECTQPNTLLESIQCKRKNLTVCLSCFTAIIHNRLTQHTNSHHQHQQHHLPSSCIYHTHSSH